MVDFSAPLKTNDFLHVGEYIASPKGLFYAIMQEDGNFCIYQGSGPSNNQGLTWALNREGGVQALPPAGAYFALLQANGNFCICRGSGPADSLGVIWALDQGGGVTSFPPGGAYFALMQDDGSFCVYQGNAANPGSLIWSTAPAQKAVTPPVVPPPPPSPKQYGAYLTSGQVLYSGDYLISNNKVFYSIMETGGIFNLRQGSGPSNDKGQLKTIAWRANLPPVPPCFAIMQPDGNFCVYQGTGPSDNNKSLYWAINSGAEAFNSGDPNMTLYPGSFAYQRNDGNLCVYQGSPDNPGPLVWSLFPPQVNVYMCNASGKSGKIERVNVGPPGHEGLAELWGPVGGTGTTLISFVSQGCTCLLRYDATNGAIYIDMLSMYGYPMSGWGIPNTNSWQSPANLWGTGMTLTPFVSQGNNYILQYNPTNGNVGIDRLNADASGTTATWRPATNPWETGMTIIPFVSQGATYMMQYNPMNGKINIDRLNADGSGSTATLRTSGTPSLVSSGGTGVIMTPFVSQGNNYILSYNTRNGGSGIYQFIADGSGIMPTGGSAVGSWGTGMTITPFVSQGNNYILQYNPSDGTTGIDQLNADGSGSTATWRPSAKLWLGTQITLFTFQGATYVIQYNATNGTMGVDRINADGSGITNVSQPVSLFLPAGMAAMTTIVPLVVPQ